MVILGSLWLINGMLSFFMVEYEEENDDLTEEKSDAGKIQSPNQRIIMKKKEAFYGIFLYLKTSISFERALIKN